MCTSESVCEAGGDDVGGLFYCICGVQYLRAPLYLWGADSFFEVQNVGATILNVCLRVKTWFHGVDEGFRCDGEELGNMGSQ